MNSFIYKYPVKIYSGKGCTENSLKTELLKTGKNVLFAFGGGSVKKNRII